MLGPFLLIVGFTVAGALTAGWAGGIGGALIAVFLTGAVAAGALAWANTIGRHLDPTDAWAEAPRPPLFRRLVEAVYRRTLPR